MLKQEILQLPVKKTQKAKKKANQKGSLVYFLNKTSELRNYVKIYTAILSGFERVSQQNLKFSDTWIVQVITSMEKLKIIYLTYKDLQNI